MMVFDSSPADIDPLEIERLRTIILSYDDDKAVLGLADDELLKVLGFTRDQNGVVYLTVAGLLMVGKVSGLKRFVPMGAASFQVPEGTRMRIDEDYVLPILPVLRRSSLTWRRGIRKAK